MIAIGEAPLLFDFDWDGRQTTIKNRALVVEPPGAIRRAAPAAALAPQSEPSRTATDQEIDIFAQIERLADLQKKGILSSEEFAAKKAELLSRL